MFRRNDNENFRYTCLDQRVQRIKNHRPVIDREQLFRRDGSEREQSSACSASEDDSLHKIALVINDMPEKLCRFFSLPDGYVSVLPLPLFEERGRYSPQSSSLPFPSSLAS